MTGAEPPVGSAAWSTAVGVLVVGALTPMLTAQIIVASAGVVIGISLRRTLAGIRGRPVLQWRAEAGLCLIELLISVLIIQRTDYSPLSALGIGVGVATSGSVLIERLLARFEAWIDRMLPAMPSIPIPPSDPISPRNASPNARRQLTERESPIAQLGAKLTPSPGLPGQDRDQDLLDRLPADEPGQ